MVLAGISVPLYKSGAHGSAMMAVLAFASIAMFFLGWYIGWISVIPLVLCALLGIGLIVNVFFGRSQMG